ncbi:MAG: hypothetical protein AAF226_05510, partial [Verrucomicrobiota bacterium]
YQDGKIVRQNERPEFSDHEKFFDNSRKLKSDIEDFNQSPDNSPFFQVTGRDANSEGRLVFDRNAHKIRLPFPDLGGYQGVSQPYASALVNKDLELRILRPKKQGALSEERLITEHIWEKGTGRQYAASQFLLTEKSYPVVSLWREDGVILAKCFTGMASVKINGQVVNQKNQTESVETLRRRHADPNRDLNTFELFLDDRLTIGSSDFVVSSKVGVFGTNSTQLGKELTNAMSLLMKKEEYREAIQTFVMEMTLDQPLHNAAQKHLENKARQSSHLLDRPCAMTIMDADNGHLLALASFPTKKELDRFDELAVARRISFSTPKRNRLRQNQNFLQVPPGSQTKPIIGASAWQARPQLRQLKVGSQTMRTNGSGNVTGMLGLNFGEFRNLGGAPWGPVSAIYDSSNPYFVQLYLASFADPSSYSLSNGYINHRGIDFGNYISGDRISNFSEAEVHQVMKAAFDVDLNEVLWADRLLDYDGSILAPLLNHLGVGTDPKNLPAELRGVSVERTNFRMNQMRLLRGDAIGFVLGGSTNAWSTVKLAEAFGRLATGKKVEARLLVDLDQSDPGAGPIPPNFDPLPLDSDVLAIVQEGMEGTVQTGSASSRLRSDLSSLNRSYQSKGVRFRIFSKTGTGRKGKVNNGSYVFAMTMESTSGTYLGGASCAIYLEHRLSSARAVEVAKPILSDIANYLYEKKGPNS